MNVCCRSDSVVQEIALGGLEKEDAELNQLDRAVFSKVSWHTCTICINLLLLKGKVASHASARCSSLR